MFTDELGRPLVPKSMSQNFDRLVARYERIRRSPERPAAEVSHRPHERSPRPNCSSTERAVELALTAPP